MNCHAKAQIRRSWTKKARLGKCRRRKVGCFESLEPRLLLSASSLGGRPYIDLGPSDNVALDQPRVSVELISGQQALGPSVYNTWLLDTGANSILTFRNAVDEMNEFPPNYQVEGRFEELCVGGSQLFDISAAYRFDFAGHDLDRRTLNNTRLISDATRDLSLFGPWGIVGMPAMTERYTSLDFTGWLTFDLDNLLMKTTFPSSLPAPSGPRYTLSVDNRVKFSPEGHVISGNHPPSWADLPFFEAQVANSGHVSTGNFLFDTGAQVSIISTRMAMELGLDSNLDGELDEQDANFARLETVGGVGGVTTVPVFQIDQVHIPTDQGPDLVWTDLQWLVLDITESIDGVFGFDNVTSGWVGNLFSGGQEGYFRKSHFDFHGWNATGEGKIHFDLNPDVHAVVNSTGPGAIIEESGGTTLVSESGHTDSYTIRLRQQPTADVFISLVTPENQVTARRAGNPTQSVLQFTPTNWNVPQTVIVTAVDDATPQSFHRGFVRHVSTSSAPNYNGIGMPRIVVNIVDNDFPAVMILRPDGKTEVTEGGATDTYQLVLTYPPTQNVTIQLQHFAGQVTAVKSTNGSDSIVFTPANWNTPQSVRVTAINDLLVEGTHRAWITHTITTADAGYQEAFALQELVTVIDNDSAPPPRLTNVIIASSQWSQSVIDVVDGQGVGTGNGLGLSLLGSNQLTNLSWNNIDRIYLAFSADVGATFNQGNVKLVGTNVSNYSTLMSFTYGVVGTNIGEIKLSSPLAADALILALSTGVKNALGVSLDGEWLDAVSTQSGNGNPGGQFNFRINSLPGDADSNGLVQIADIVATRSKLASIPSTIAAARLDIDGDAGVRVTDLIAIRARLATQLPAPPPMPSFGSGGGSGGQDGGVFTVFAPSSSSIFLDFLTSSRTIAARLDSLPSLLRHQPGPAQMHLSPHRDTRLQREVNEQVSDHENRVDLALMSLTRAPSNPLLIAPPRAKTALRHFGGFDDS
jgi:hypothetical protein